jgi:predicted permease
VVAFALGLSLLAAILSGLAPARLAARTNVVSALKDEAQAAPERLRLRNAFVVAQVACSLLLVVIGSLLVRALDRTSSVDRGFDPAGVDVVALDLSLAGHTEATGPQFFRDITARVRAIPGVESATLADRTPGPGGMSLGGLTIPGAPLPDGQSYRSANWTFVESGYFTTLRIPLRAGRDFNDGDRAGAPLVALVSDTAVERFWPGMPRETVVGTSIAWQPGAGVGPSLLQPGGGADASRPPVRTLLVIGVVGDVDFSRGRGVQPALYVPLQQGYLPNVTLLARTGRDKAAADAIRSVLASMDPNLPAPTVQALEDQQNGPVEVQLRVAASVAGSVGAVGLLLAAIGVYGVTAYVVTRRTREIGIRLALGASRRDVVRMILGQGMSLVAIGSVIGLLLAAGASRILARSPLNTPPIDWLALAAGAVLFSAVGLIACYVPVRRATRIHATEALRYE